MKAIWEKAEPGSIGQRLDEPIVMVPGNAKARRRWRRRGIPNAQRGVRMGARHLGWHSAPINAGVTLTLGDRSVDVTGQTNEEMAETAARMINDEAAMLTPTGEYKSAQRPSSNMAAQSMAAWAAADDAMERAIGEWASTVNVASFGESGPPTMRVAKVDRETREITMESLRKDNPGSVLNASGHTNASGHAMAVGDVLP